MKKLFNKFKEKVLGLLIVFLPIVTFVVVVYIGYLIAISDLPDWLKFFLLK